MDHDLLQSSTPSVTYVDDNDGRMYRQSAKSHPEPSSLPPTASSESSNTSPQKRVTSACPCLAGCLSIQQKPLCERSVRRKIWEPSLPTIKERKPSSHVKTLSSGSLEKSLVVKSPPRSPGLRESTAETNAIEQGGLVTTSLSDSSTPLSIVDTSTSGYLETGSVVNSPPRSPGRRESTKKFGSIEQGGSVMKSVPVSDSPSSPADASSSGSSEKGSVVNSPPRSPGRRESTTESDFIGQGGSVMQSVPVSLSQKDHLKVHVQAPLKESANRLPLAFPKPKGSAELGTTKQKGSAKISSRIQKGSNEKGSDFPKQKGPATAPPPSSSSGTLGKGSVVKPPPRSPGQRKSTTETDSIEQTRAGAVHPSRLTEQGGSVMKSIPVSLSQKDRLKVHLQAPLKESANRLPLAFPKPKGSAEICATKQKVSANISSPKQKRSNKESLGSPKQKGSATAPLQAPLGDDLSSGMLHRVD